MIPPHSLPEHGATGTNLIDLTTGASLSPPTSPADDSPSTPHPTATSNLLTTVDAMHQTLNSEAYLNDTIINAGLSRIIGHNLETGYLTTFCMAFFLNPHNPRTMLHPWYQKLRQAPHKTWYIPICHNHTHWIFLKIDPRLHHIAQYDSLLRLGTEDYTHRLWPFLEDRDQHPWSTGQGQTPQQINGYDCGVHVLAEIHRQVNHHPHTNMPANRASVTVLLTEGHVNTMYVTDHTVAYIPC